MSKVVVVVVVLPSDAKVDVIEENPDANDVLIGVDVDANGAGTGAASKFASRTRVAPSKANLVPI